MRSISRRNLVTQVLPGVTAAATLSAVASPAASFLHGVASGDPTQSAVIIWTRVTPRFNELTQVEWEVASRADFGEVLRSGTVITSSDRDFTVKADVTDLPAGQSFFYRFSALGAQSEVGRTRTLPTGKVEAFTLAVCSCSNYPAGYFNAYRHMAERDDIDLVLHLGDYIYEYPRGGYASENAGELRRESLPGHETVSLDDYRARHAQYKSDPDLQAVHSQVPFMTSWDDHEVANDGWTGGAQNHGAGEGPWSQRKAAAMRAYFEWMPVREPAGRPPDQLWRAAEIGDLATITMIETRLSSRDRPVDMGEAMIQQAAPYDFSDPANPVPAREGSDPAHVREVTLPFNIQTEPPEPITDYAEIARLAALPALPEGLAYLPDGRRFRRDVLDKPGRELLGNAQKTFIRERLKRSKASQKPWQVIGNQTLLSPLQHPNVANDYDEQTLQQVAPWIQPKVENSRYNLPLGTDSWDGYGAERQWLLNAHASVGSNLLVVSGDSHAAWGLELETASYPAWRGVELGTTSVSSPGFPENLALPAELIEARLKQSNPRLRYSNVADRGYLTVRLSPEKAEVTFERLTGVSSRQFRLRASDGFTLRPGTGEGVAWS
ncbi:MAG: alkaline phosphatase D family protein [Pseudomonadota bacterium]